jgi:ribonuclease HI
VVVATDGSVKDDGRMGAAYVALDNRLPPRSESFVVLGPPSSMRGELSGIDAAVADAPGEEDLTILTDSLTSIQKLASMQRQDFPERLNGHPEKVLLESLVRRINERARAQVFTRIVKCPAHKAHPLNEAADAAASRAAEEGDVETAALSHADSKAVRFCPRGRLTEWGAGVRRALAQVETSHYQALLTERLTRQATSDEPGADLPDDRRGGRAVSLTAQWLLRPEQGRQYLGAAMAEFEIFSNSVISACAIGSLGTRKPTVS